MTTLDPRPGARPGADAGADAAHPPEAAGGPRPWPRVLAGAVLAGVLLGAVDLALQVTLPYPWANLANSSAVWAVGAFAVGARVGGSARAAAAGAITLLVAVEAYYVTAILTSMSDVSTLWEPSTVTWLFFGLVGGPAFGLAGAWSRRAPTWAAAAGMAVPVAVLLGEALLDAPSATAAITAALAVVLLGGFAVRRPGAALTALVLSLPLAGACLAAFRLAGFAGLG